MKPNRLFVCLVLNVASTICAKQTETTPLPQTTAALQQLSKTAISNVDKGETTAKPFRAPFITKSPNNYIKIMPDAVPSSTESSLQNVDENTLNGTAYEENDKNIDNDIVDNATMLFLNPDDDPDWQRESISSNENYFINMASLLNENSEFPMKAVSAVSSTVNTEYVGDDEATSDEWDNNLSGMGSTVIPNWLNESVDIYALTSGRFSFGTKGGYDGHRNNPSTISTTSQKQNTHIAEHIASTKNADVVTKTRESIQKAMPVKRNNMGISNFDESSTQTSRITTLLPIATGIHDDSYLYGTTEKITASSSVSTTNAQVFSSAILSTPTITTTAAGNVNNDIHHTAASSISTTSTTTSTTTTTMTTLRHFDKSTQAMSVVDSAKIKIDDVKDKIAAVINVSRSVGVESDYSNMANLLANLTDTTWPVKHSAIVEGDVILGGLMMVHSREDTITCGPIMPQGGIQALEVMLFTLDRINEIGLLPNISLGAHILDDCDKDTYGLEMAVDFIKGKHSLLFYIYGFCVLLTFRMNN